MKKTLLLSVVASTMIMAGGDIAPVEPVVEAPAPVASGWEFSGNAAVYYQTNDATASVYDVTGATPVLIENLGGDLFDQEQSAADAGIQLRATNSDVIGGIGAGFAVNGLSTLNLENFMVSHVMQLTSEAGDIDDVTDGGWISEAYLTYGFGNTSIKAGRQTLPKALSPFAFSESWNVFPNTYDAVLLVNTDISNTTLVGAWVAGNNVNSLAPLSDLTDFNSINGDRGVYMLTVQNKSISDLTLTGSWYYGSDFYTATDDAINILWGDAQYNAGNFNLGVQGGQVSHDQFADDITAFGAKVGTELAGINLSAAYSNVNDGGAPLVQPGSAAPMGFGMFNIGGSTSALYTTTLVDQLMSSSAMNYDSDKFVVSANMDALGGNISALYANIDMNAMDNTADELNIGYSTNITDSLNLTATYAYISFDDKIAVLNELETEATVMDEDTNVVRVVARYNF